MDSKSEEVQGIVEEACSAVYGQGYPGGANNPNAGNSIGPGGGGGGANGAGGSPWNSTTLTNVGGAALMLSITGIMQPYGGGGGGGADSRDSTNAGSGFALGGLGGAGSGFIVGGKGGDTVATNARGTGGSGKPNTGSGGGGGGGNIASGANNSGSGGSGTVIVKYRAPTSCETFYTSGFWVCPLGVTTVQALIVAGGGGGGLSQAADRGAGGGGAGGLIYNSAVSVTPGTTYQVMVGFGGALWPEGASLSFRVWP